MQLQDHEFTAWLDRLVEARKNRQEKRQRPYRNFRKPYNEGRQNGDTGSRPSLRNRIKPAQELEIQQIMDNFNCEYDDVVEAVDLYNLDVEECVGASSCHDSLIFMSTHKAMAARCLSRHQATYGLPPSAWPL